MFQETDFPSLRPTLGQWLDVAGPVAPVVLQILISQWFDQGQLKDVVALLRFLERSGSTSLAGAERAAQACACGRYGGPLEWRR